MTFSIVIDASDFAPAANKVRLLADLNLGAAVNASTARGYVEARRQMLTRVNLTDAYVSERMAVEEAADLRNPTAKIIAFRQGGRRKGMRSVNLRQYGAVINTAANNWTNAGVAVNSGKRIFEFANTPHRKGGVGPNPGNTVLAGTGGNGLSRLYANPRKPGGLLPFIRRIGDAENAIPVGRKQAGVSVEVQRGNRKLVTYAFMRRMPNGEILVMARDKGDHKGKGKIHALSSLSVWQLFKANMATIIPFIQTELRDEVLLTLDEQIKRAVA